jgi:hypothetical protein
MGLYFVFVSSPLYCYLTSHLVLSPLSFLIKSFFLFRRKKSELAQSPSSPVYFHLRHQPSQIRIRRLEMEMQIP